MSKEVTFVFLGNKFPSYVEASLTLANKYSGLKVHLIGETKIQNSILSDQIIFTHVDDFYDRENFKQVSKKILLPHAYRDGFWLKTLERFFVLRDYFNTFNCESIFHAELDQLLFNCDQLIREINSTDLHGIFVPIHSPTRAIASIFYCNDFFAIDRFVRYVQESEPYENEMRLLASWAVLDKEHVHPLPTLATKLDNSNFLKQNGFSVFKNNYISGIVDGAQLGQWVAGQDPRNLVFKEVPKNKYVEAPDVGSLSFEQLSQLEFNLLENNNLFVSFSDGLKFKIYNLHIHSKIHKWLSKSNNLNLLFIYANRSTPVRFPGTRNFQLKYLLINALTSFANRPSDSFKSILKKIIKKFQIKVEFN